MNNLPEVTREVERKLECGERPGMQSARLKKTGGKSYSCHFCQQMSMFTVSWSSEKLSRGKGKSESQKCKGLRNPSSGNGVRGEVEVGKL